MEWVVGQEVTVKSDSRILKITKVQRLTKTLVILEDGSRWKMDGRALHRVKWTYERIVPTIPAHHEVEERARLIFRMESHKWRDVPLETLRMVNAVLEHPDAIVAWRRPGENFTVEVWKEEVKAQCLPKPSTS